jgi:hopanoid C-3 methylase
LFDVQHAVLPTKLPLEEFYRQLVGTQQVLNRKHLGWAGLKDTVMLATRLAMQGQTNFIRMLWKFNGVYNVERQTRDHQRPVAYNMKPPAPGTAVAGRVPPASLYVHPQHLLKPLRASASD